MKNIILLLQKIEKEPINIDKLSLLDEEINYLILRIELCSNPEDANIYFDMLDNIQLTLAKIHYKYGPILSNYLQQFIKDFDCLYDREERKRLFNIIKSHRHDYKKQSDRLLLKVLENIYNEPIKTNVIPLFSFLYKEINCLLGKIQHCENIGTAKVYFDILQKIQEVLAELAFRYEIAMPSNLYKFIRDCDRLDDTWLREYLLDKLKKGQYSLAEDTISAGSHRQSE